MSRFILIKTKSVYESVIHEDIRATSDSANFRKWLKLIILAELLMSINCYCSN